MPLDNKSILVSYNSPISTGKESKQIYSKIDYF